MEQDKSIQVTNPSSIQSPQESVPTPDPKTISHIPLPKPSPKKPFLRKPLFWIVIIILFLFAGAYLFIYSSLENNISKFSKSSQKQSVSIIAIPSANPGFKDVTVVPYQVTIPFPTDYVLDGVTEFKQASPNSLFFRYHDITNNNEAITYDLSKSSESLVETMKRYIGAKEIHSGQTVQGFMNNESVNFSIKEKQINGNTFLIAYPDEHEFPNYSIYITRSGNITVVIAKYSPKPYSSFENSLQSLRFNPTTITNPYTQQDIINAIAETHNKLREKYITALIDAIKLYYVHFKYIPKDISYQEKEISSTGVNLCGDLVRYSFINIIPVDPTLGSTRSVHNCNTPFNTGFTIKKDASKVYISAPNAELGRKLVAEFQYAM